MERIAARTAWVLAAVLVAGCSSEVQTVEDATVAGVVLEREAADAGQGGDDGDDSDPSDPTPAPASDDAVAGLVLVTSGPTAVGTTWILAAGEWVGLDGQTLQSGRDPTALHLDTLLEAVDAEPGQVAASCEVRLTAPDDAELEAQGVIEAELVVDRGSGDLERITLAPLDIDVMLAIGEDHREPVATVAAMLDTEVDSDVQVRCEGRFSRS